MVGLCLCDIVVAQPDHLQLKQDQTHYTLESKLFYARDPSNRVTVDELLNNPTDVHWLALQTDTASFGYDTATYWFRLKIDSIEHINSRWLLEVAYPMLDFIDVYFVVDQAIVKVVRSGDRRDFSDREIGYRDFLFVLPERYNKELESYVVDNVDIYVRVQSEGSVEVPFALWQSEAFWEYEQLRLMARGALYGIVLILAIYNFFVYVFVREKSYLIYVFFALFYTLYQMSTDGLSFQYLWPSMPAWNHISFIFFASLTLCLLCLFSISFLALRRKSRVFYFLLIGVSSLVIVNALVGLFVPYHITVRVLVALVPFACFLSFLAGLNRFSDGGFSARYFVAAWTAFLVGLVLYVLAKAGYLPVNMLTAHAMHIGAVIQVVAFSIGLADRINTDKKARIEAKQEAIESLEQFKNIYENALEGMFEATLDGDLINVNPALAALAGYDSPQAMLTKYNNHKYPYSDENPDFKRFGKMVASAGQILDFETEVRRHDGSSFWCSVSGRVVNNSRIEGFVVDITHRIESEKHLRYLASHDPLTGLLNRTEFDNRAKQALKKSKLLAQTHGLLFMDLDQFKLVNDTCGHAAGDELLRQITFQVQNVVRDTDVLARLGGDEFGVLIECCKESDALQIAHGIRRAIQEFRFTWDDKSFSLGVSIGLVMLDKHCVSLQSVMSMADAACYQAKDLGRNRVHVYSVDAWENEPQQRDMQWASLLSTALEHDHFVLYRQDIVPLSRSDAEPESAHYEVLVRLLDGDKEVPPGAFLPAAERFNMMPALDRWVLNRLFFLLAAKPPEEHRLATYAVNLSGLTFNDDDFGEFLEDLFKKYPVNPALMCFEITETAAMLNLSKVVAFIKKFKAYGCRFSLDDFGSGFSSYGYLKNLPVDYLKIDGAFVRDICDDPIDYAMVESINKIGKVMGKKTIAEFVENESVAERLRTIGVDYGQGYHFMKPQKIDR